MGKMQSKHKFYRKRDGPEGECFVVSAHFNPVAVSIDTVNENSKSASEISLHVNGGRSSEEMKAGFAEDKYPLQVVLPPEGEEGKEICNEDGPSVKDDMKDTKSGLSLEQFECDVSVKAEDGVERQEFLFTLYDFDGHGKITKDDIVGLIRSIYDTVGTSVKLPPSGSKMIKVRLTVSPDKRKKETNDKCHTADCLRNEGLDLLQQRKPPRPTTFYKQNLMDVVHANALDKNLRMSALGNEEFSKCRHRHRHANNRDNVVECRDRRNHYLDLAGIENYSSRFNNDSSGNDVGTTDCPFQSSEGGRFCPKSAKSHFNSHARKVGHHRSRSHDLTVESVLLQCQLLDEEQMKRLGLKDLVLAEESKLNEGHSRSKSYDPQEGKVCSPRPTKLPHSRKTQLANGHLASPHHHKHRHREREHQRAMQQVANWIEREHLGIGKKRDERTLKGGGGGGGGSPLVIERHEHHHVHEHVHHHYHHHYSQV